MSAILHITLPDHGIPIRPLVAFFQKQGAAITPALHWNYRLWPYDRAVYDTQHRYATTLRGLGHLCTVFESKDIPDLVSIAVEASVFN